MPGPLTVQLNVGKSFEISRDGATVKINSIPVDSFVLRESTYAKITNLKIKGMTVTRDGYNLRCTALGRREEIKLTPAHGGGYSVPNYLNVDDFVFCEQIIAQKYASYQFDTAQVAARRAQDNKRNVYLKKGDDKGQTITFTYTTKKYPTSVNYT